MSDERDELCRRWIEKSAEMRGQRRLPDCAAPFISVAPPRYDPEQIPSILYVGKATRGLWGDREDVGELLDQQEKFTVNSLADYAAEWLEKNIWNRGWRRPGPFWYFARSLSETVASVTHSEIDDLQNLVWTNISKIGVGIGNPGGEYLELQKDLSVNTLRYEILHYKPKIVFWVNGDYASDVVNRVVSDPRQETWQKGDSDLWYWWRGPVDGMPAMIWAGHPQGKKQIVLNSWLDKARDLVSSTNRD